MLWAAEHGGRGRGLVALVEGRRRWGAGPPRGLFLVAVDELVGRRLRLNDGLARVLLEVDAAQPPPPHKCTRRQTQTRTHDKYRFIRVKGR